MSTPVYDRARQLGRRVLRQGKREFLALSPGRRRRNKYAAEEAFWQAEFRHLMAWYEGREAWLGVPCPAVDPTIAPGIPALAAVQAFHTARPYYFAHLELGADHFAGQRVLEVGCGPMAPILQFAGCERHGIDPLVDAYIRDGWPMYAYEGTFVNGGAESMPYPDGWFDAAIAVNSLDHVDDFAAVAREMERVVRRGGRLYFEVEYHQPSVTEPIALDDDKVRRAFTRTTLVKIAERPSHEVYAASGIEADHRSEPFVVWHGTVGA